MNAPILGVFGWIALIGLLIWYTEQCSTPHCADDAAIGALIGAGIVNR